LPFAWSLVGSWSMPWQRLPELFFPNLLGHITHNQFDYSWASRLYPGRGGPFLFSIYPGLLIATLTIGAAFVRPRGGRFVLIVCAARGILGILVVHFTMKKRLQVSSVILTAWVVLDLAMINREINPTRPVAQFAPSPIASRFPSAHDSYRIFHEADWYEGQPV